MKAFHRRLLLSGCAALLCLFPAVHLPSADQPAPTPPAAADSPAPIDWKSLQAEEDRIDELPPAERGPALIELRRLLPETASTAGQAIQQRLTLKLNYVTVVLNLTLGHNTDTQSPYADRLAASRLAADIGATYLKQNDPQRALRWVPHSRQHAPESLWPDDLRNRIHAWFDQRLQAALAQDNGPQAREELAVWKKTMGADLAVAQAVDRYAQVRGAALIELLNTADARTVLARLSDEERENPGAAAWQAVRDRVAQHLDRAFQNGLTSRNIPAAEAALAEQQAIARDYHFDFNHAPVASNNLSLQALIRDLQPSPIQRAGGQVRSVQFRIEVMEAIGQVSYRHDSLTFSAFNYFPYAIGDWRIYGDDSNANWFGFNMTGLSGGTGKNFQSANRFQSQGFFLFGRRGAHWSGSLGIGGIYNVMNFTDGLSLSRSQTTTVAGGLRLSYEHLVSDKWSLNGTLILGLGGNVSTYEFKSGFLYYFNHNWSVGLQIMVTGINVGATADAGRFYMAAQTIGPSMLMQF